MATAHDARPSFEALLEGQGLELEILHPGGLDLTRELVELCQIAKGTSVLDVASGTGESGCYLAEQFGCQVVGVDASEAMLAKARQKAKARQLPVEFKQGDAHQLPFADNTFDLTVSECTICLLEKERAIREMVRVTKPGGSVGMHDICWQASTPELVKQRLAEVEGERPETLAGWQALFERAGLAEVRTVDKSDVVPIWMRSLKRQLGFVGRFKLFLHVLSVWGLAGWRDVRESEEIFEGGQIGYGIIAGKKL